MQANAQAWLHVETAIQAQVDALAYELANTATPSMGQLQRSRRYHALMEQTRDELRKYEDYLEPRIRSGQADMITAAMEHSRQAVNAVATEAQVVVQFDRLPVSAVNDAVGLAGDGSPLRAVLRDASRVGPEALGEQLVTGIALGRNPITVARQAMRLGLGQSFTRMQAIYRTEQLRVYRETSLASYANSNVVVGYRRLSARDDRVCPGCLMSDGRVYRIDEGFDEHVQGRCTMIPILRNVPPVQYQTGQQWFAEQPEATQRKILGAGRYDTWKAGRASLDDMVTRRDNATWGGSLHATNVRDLAAGRGGLPPAARLPGAGAAPVPVAAPAQQKPTPAGTPVSNALTAPKGKLKNDVDVALTAIDKVHGDGDLPSIPIKPTAGERRLGAYQREVNRLGQTRSLDIGVSTKGDHRSLTLVHEIGHFIDFEKIGVERQVRGSWHGGSIEKEVENVLKSLRGSEAVRKIDALMSTTERLRYADNPEKTYRADFKYCYYLKSDVELWARSYAQYVATRSGDSVLLKSIEGALVQARNETGYPVQWEAEDFAPIASAIDDLFRAKGWIR
jgi:SPP1 gp7 family putative phage head morphogenesis protein